MKRFIIFSAVLSLLVITNACNQKKPSESIAAYQCPMKCEGEDKTYDKPGTCPVCKMDLKQLGASTKVKANSDEISDASIFNLSSKWKTQNDETIELKDLKGDILVVVMIYTHCQAACPRLVADMRNIHAKVGDDPSIKYVMVSIDPKRDTPERLKEFAIENHMDNDQWVFLQGSIDDVREFSNVLAVKYKQISPEDFSHSNIISVFDEGGELQYQQEGLGVDNRGIVSKIHELKG